MAKINSYPSGTLNLTDYFIGTDRDNDNVTRSYKVSEVINTIIAALGIGTVTSISTVSSNYINVTGGPITVTGTVTAALSATGTPSGTTFLTGDDTWSLPGPTPSTVAILYNGTQLTADANSMDYTGNVTATAAGLSTTVNMPGQSILVDSVIAGTAISVSAPTGNVTITNTGVTLARAGGNVTLSGGTGGVTVSTTANPGTVSNVAPGLGVATIINSSSNPEIDLEFTGVNNYISRSLDITTSLPEDLVEFNDLSGSVIKNMEIGDIPPAILTAVKTYIDDEDKNKLKNTTDTYTSTEKALNMVSLTAGEYLVLQSGGILDENTLYFIIGAGVAYTVTPDVTATISGDTGYTISTTPSSVSGVAGTPYTFTTTVNVQPGGSFAGTNPVITTDTINSTSGTPYPKAIAVTGAYTAPTIPSGRAQYQATLGGNLLSYLSFLTFTGIHGVPYPGPVVNPTSFTQGTVSYSFLSSDVAISTTPVDYTSTYSLSGKSISDPSGSFTPTIFEETLPVAGTISGTVAFIEYEVDLAVTNSIGVTGAGASTPTYNMDFISTGSQIQSSTIILAGSTSGTISSAITLLNQSDTFGFSLNNLNWTLPADYTWSVSPTLTVDSSSSPISGANGTAAVTVSGTILYTAPPSVEYRKLDATAVIQANVTGYANGTINNAVQITNGVSGTFTYTVPTIVPNTGYYLTGGVVTLAVNPITFNSTPGQSGTGTWYDPIIENNPVVTTGAIAASKATVTVNCAAVPFSTSITYQTSFAPGSAATRTLTTTNTQTATNTNFSVGDGIVIVTISRTSPSSTSEDAGSILWSLNGVAQGSPSPLIFSSGTTINYSRTISGVSHGDTILVSIAEG